MKSRERIYHVINGEAADHIPLTTWCFGFKAPKHLRWSDGKNEIKYWYTKRLEHIHTLPQSWTLKDDFKRTLAWLSVGIDDILDISVPWNTHPDVSWEDSVIPVGVQGGDQQYPVLVRDYKTPVGMIRHAMKKTGNEEEGWPVQPECVKLFEDYNVPRGIRHLIMESSDIDKAKYLFLPPGNDQKKWFANRVREVKQFADKHGIFVQAWTAFGMDAVIWMTGVENATFMALTDPESFMRLINNIYETDIARTELALTTPGIDMICQRGWYSSTDFWSPEIFEQFIFPQICRIASLVHRHGKKFAYTMSTGVEVLGPRLADAGVDVIYFIDPILDKLSVSRARELFGNRITMVGGINSMSLANGDPEKIRQQVKEAIEILGPTNRLILHPVDSLFPDTNWRNLEVMINAWEGFT